MARIAISLCGEGRGHATRVATLVDHLEARGLVERKADADDRRRVMCSLTAAGRRALQHGDALVGARLGRLLDRLPDEEAEHVRVGLESLNRAMELALADRFGDTAPGT